MRAVMMAEAMGMTMVVIVAVLMIVPIMPVTMIVVRAMIVIGRHRCARPGSAARQPHDGSAGDGAGD
jgi:hypothetical protein